MVGEQLDNDLPVGLSDARGETVDGMTENAADGARVPVAGSGGVSDEGAVDVPQNENVGEVTHASTVVTRRNRHRSTAGCSSRTGRSLSLHDAPGQTPHRQGRARDFPSQG
jgi:hypothetical protein